MSSKSQVICFSITMKQKHAGECFHLKGLYLFKMFTLGFSLLFRLYTTFSFQISSSPSPPREAHKRYTEQKFDFFCPIIKNFARAIAVSDENVFHYLLLGNLVDC